MLRHGPSWAPAPTDGGLVDASDLSGQQLSPLDADRFADVGGLFLLAAGDEDLAVLDAVQDEVLAARIQLGEHVVQQQHRQLAGVRLEEIPLRQLQTDGGGTSLALGAEGLEADVVQGS